MKLKKLGRTDIEVSEICLGSMTWGSQNSEAEAHEQLDYAVAEGVNFIDTAEMYPTTPRLAETTGRTEEFIGSWLRARPDRDNLVVATKITGEGNKDIRDGQRVTGAMIREALEDSLRRLQTDHVDLYQLHWPNRGSYHFRKYWTFDPTNLSVGDMEQEVADMLGEVSLLQQEGKLRTFGLSNESAWGTMKYLAASERLGLPRIASIQNAYSFVNRTFEGALAEVAKREDVGLLAYSVLAQGYLTGKYQNGALPAGARKTLFDRLQRYEHPRTLAAIDAYLALAREADLDPAQMAIAHAMSRSFVTSVILGATRMEQLETNIAAAELVLDAGVLEKIDALHQEFGNPAP